MATTESWIFLAQYLVTLLGIVIIFIVGAIAGYVLIEKIIKSDE
jgi:uncharacterized protein YneF (UPF0154 family)